MAQLSVASLRDKIRSNSRAIAVLLITAALFATVIAVLATAPISEITVHIQNSDEQDTAHLVLYLDDSAKAYMYIGPGGWSSWKFHVSPGTHTVGIDFSYNYSYENEHDQVIDFELEYFVGFNGAEDSRLLVRKYLIMPHPADMMHVPGSPLEQAAHDPYVVIPVVTMTVLHLLLVVVLSNRGKSREPTTEQTI